MRGHQKNNHSLMVAAILVVIGTGAVSVWAKDPDKSDSVTIKKTEDGLHFTVPPDWPIEKRGGVTAPIPIEEYLSRKFKGIETQLQTLEQRINGLDVRQRALEESVKQDRQARRAAEDNPAPSPTRSSER